MEKKDILYLADRKFRELSAFEVAEFLRWAIKEEHLDLYGNVTLKPEHCRHIANLLYAASQKDGSYQKQRPKP
jgi:hypothetical protein